jgi:hypothetical protein
MKSAPFLADTYSLARRAGRVTARSEKVDPGLVFAAITAAILLVLELTGAVLW